MNNKLYYYVRKKGFPVNHVAEVGVYYPETSNILDFINNGVRSTLVEADPLCVERIDAYFKRKSNVKIYPYAIWDKNETVVLYRAKASTFIGSLENSPALVNDNYHLKDEDKFVAEGKVFSDIDDGTIDLLSIDIEGAEWYVIKHLRSQPSVISLEMQADTYVNPHLKEINDWMKNNEYKLWFFNDTDAIYLKDCVVQFDLFERVGLFLYNLMVHSGHNIRKIRKKIKNKLIPKK